MPHNPLDAIQARADAATKGPWRLWRDPSDPENKRGASVETAWSHDAEGEDTDLITDWCAPEDAEFIAAAREDAPKLVAALRAVEAVHVREDAEQFYNGIDGGSYSTIKYYCGTCMDIDEAPYTWPCPTIRAIREALG